MTGRAIPELVDSVAIVNACHVYPFDDAVGPCFIKFCSYFPHIAKLCISGHEWLKPEARAEAEAAPEINGPSHAIREQRVEYVGRALHQSRVINWGFRGRGTPCKLHGIAQGLRDRIAKFRSTAILYMKSEARGMNVQARPTDRSHRKATYQDVLDAPSHMVAEVLAGTLHTQPRPAMRHAWASSRLAGRLDGPFGPDGDGPGGWWIVFEPELHLGDDIVVPDLAGWRRETMPEYLDAAYCTIAPDWACEVLSPSTRRIDQSEKREVYAREGVSHLWFVDPDARTLEGFALRHGHWMLLATLADDASVELPPFDAISFRLDALWPEGAATDGDASG